MKLIIAFALIVATSCDVSHIVQGNGWFKDASGYHYNKPETRFTEEVAVEEIVDADVPAIEESLIVAEPESVIADEVVEQIIGSDEPVSVEVPFETPVEEVVVADEQAPIEVIEPEIVAEVVADPIVEVVPEVKVNNEYLPPVDAKKKRQIPVHRVIRKVYRRFVPIKRH
ncbi:unnamed protein product [Chironomus riparius]|uniref:Uncharacterized protein n=1 Tax=Chironomus riparius TaxID=315576 RepID=A0A9N9WMF3_9DIPT|nr:unnamed protein product [Chironomus riparius]